MDASSLTPDAPLPDDVPTLQALLRQLLAEVARLRAENAELRGKLDAALKHRFGRRSERQAQAEAAEGRDRPPAPRPARPGRLARTPGTPRGRPRPDRGGKALPLLRPAARLHRRADGRATRPGAGTLLRAAHRQEELRLPALRPGGGAGRATPADRRAGAGRSDRQGAVRPGAAGPRHHRQVRRPHRRCTAWPGNWPAPACRSRDPRWATGWPGGGPAGAVVPADAPAAVAVAGDPRRRHRGEAACARVPTGRSKAHLWVGIGDADYPYVVFDFTAGLHGGGAGTLPRQATGAICKPTPWPSTRGCTARTRSSTSAAGRTPAASSWRPSEGRDERADVALELIRQLYAIERDLPPLLPPSDDPVASAATPATGRATPADAAAASRTGAGRAEEVAGRATARGVAEVAAGSGDRLCA